MLGWAGAAAAAILGALMPWHLKLSRYGIETTAASATVSIAMASFLMWVCDRKTSWLFLSSLSFGLSLYTYAVTKALVPLLLAMIAVLYWRELNQARTKALAALTIVFVIALPQAFKFVSNASLMQVEYSHLSMFSEDAICMGCDAKQTELAKKSIPSLLVANFASNFTPAFLFQHGDRGDHWTMIHPPNFGELLPEQAVLIALALIALLGSTRRKAAILILGWVLVAAVPAALIKPLGVGFYQPGEVPTPMGYDEQRNSSDTSHAIDAAQSYRFQTWRDGYDTLDFDVGAGICRLARSYFGKRHPPVGNCSPARYRHFVSQRAFPA